MQIVWSSRRGSRQIEHLGSARDEVQLEVLKAAAAQRLAAGQQSLDLGLERPGVGEDAPLEIVSSCSQHLWEALCRAYRVLGFDAAAGGDEVFCDLVAARIIEPTSKVDALRVLSETGVESPAYRTLKRRLSVFAKPEFRQALSAASAAHAQLGPASLVLYDVSTLHFETDAGDGFREPGFSKERRLDPQITVGLLTDATGFPLNVAAFEGNKAETATMVPVINAFKQAHQLTDVTVVADAGKLAFGYGIHSCLGAALARMESAIALDYLLDFMPEFDVEHDGLRRTAMTSVNGYENVPLRVRREGSQ